MNGAEIEAGLEGVLAAADGKHVGKLHAVLIRERGPR